MKDKSPMEYLMDFFLDLLKVVTDAVKKIAMAVYDAQKKKSEEDKKNEKIDVNKSKRAVKRKYPKEVEKQMSKDNMDISVEDFEKLSKDEQKRYRDGWNSLTEKQKNERREAFAQKQVPKLQDAVNRYYESQVKGRKEVSDLLPMDDMDMSRGEFNKRSKKDQQYYRELWALRSPDEKRRLRAEFMKKQQPKIDEAVKKYTPEVYQKLTNEIGQVSVFSHREQLMPRRVADQMAMEIYDGNGSLRAILPVSNEEYNKMNGAQKRNFLNSWQKLSPEEQRKRLAAFEREAKPKIQQAWQDYSKSTGDQITGEVNVFTYDAQYNLDAYDKAQEQKKMSEKERQKNELESQKLDGKQNVEKEKELEKPKEKEQELKDNVAEEDPLQSQKDPLKQGFNGKRREDRQLNQQLNEQVNNLAGNKEVEKQAFQTEQNVKKGTAQVEIDARGKAEVFKDEEEREKFREQAKEGAEKRRQDARNELDRQKDLNKNDVMDNNRAMIPNQ